MWLNSWFPCFGQITNSKKLQKYENNLEWQNTFVNLANLCLDLFVWEGLPETCNYRYMEQSLFFDGKFALVDDPKYGFLSLRCTPNNVYNIYGEFDRVHVYGFNGYTNDFNAYLVGADNSNAKAVICRDNDSFYPYYLYVTLGAERLSQAMRSIDVASYQLKHPYFVVCEESQKLSVEKILTDIGENKPAIITSKSITPEAFQILETGANPQVLQQMWDNFYKHDNNVRTILGIQNNASPDKAERLLVDEINSNNQVTEMNINMRLKTRQEFCEQANEIFGTNISVRLKYDIVENFGDYGRSEKDVNISSETTNEVQSVSDEPQSLG